MATKYTKEILTDAVQHSSNWSEMMRYLGINPKSGSMYGYIVKRVKELNIDFSHFKWQQRQEIQWSLEELKLIVAESFSWMEVGRKLGLDHHATYRSLVAYAKKSGLDFKHFTGMNWNEGKTMIPLNIQDWLNKISKSGRRHIQIKVKLFALGLKKPKCEKCGIADWMGEILPWHLDHIDGNRTNYLLDNLQILCPNCHAIKTALERDYRIVQKPNTKLHNLGPVVERQTQCV